MRRNRIDLLTPAEKAIYNAMIEIEKIGASQELTEACLLLQRAKDMVSDFIDNKIGNRIINDNID